jgi:predicted transposase/invertase (TIGR01784 family)
MERTIISFDYAIKYLLRDKANFDILSGFLTELLCRQVIVQEILESEGDVDAPDGKVNRLDLKAKIDDGEIAVFEIQYNDQIDFMGKVLFNACKAVVEQVSAGKPYNVKKVYSVNIFYDAIGAEKEYLFVASLHEFKGKHFEETIPFSQNINERSNVQKEIHPEYFLILPEKFDGQMRSKFDEWVYVLKNSSVKSEFTAAGIQAAGEKLDILKMTPQQRAAYERTSRADMDQKTQLFTAELKGRTEGEAKGLEKGEAIGLEKGEAIGRAAERTELQENVVINCHQAGLYPDTISTITRLTLEQVIEILKRHGLG